MKPVSRPAHVPDVPRGVEVGKNQLDPFDLHYADSAAIAVLEQPLKEAMPEAGNHDDSSYDKRRLSIVDAKWNSSCSDHARKSAAPKSPSIAKCCRKMDGAGHAGLLALY